MAAVKAPKLNKVMLEVLKKTGEVPTERKAIANSRGCLVLIDWQEQEVLATKEIPLPLGFAQDQQDPKRLWVASWKSDQLQLLDGNQVIKTISCALPSHIHSISAMSEPGHFLVTAGDGTVAEVDTTIEGQSAVKWAWNASEHGFATPSCSERDGSFQAIWRSCADRATNGSSALLLDNGHFLYSSAADGKLARVDVGTGKAEILRDDLDFPHDIHVREGGFTLTNSAMGQVLLLDRNGSTESVVPTKAPWLQHAVPLSGSSHFLTLQNRQMTRERDPEDSVATNSILEVDREGKFVKELNVGANNRLFQVSEVTDEQAMHWASAWAENKEFDTKAWKWWNTEFSESFVFMPSQVDDEDAAWMEEHDVTCSTMDPHGLLLLSSDTTKLVTDLPGERIRALSYQFGLAAQRLGEVLVWQFGRVLDVTVKDDPSTSVESTEHVEMHFDGMFRGVPTHQFFQCVRAPRAGTGGETTFFFTARLLSDLEKEKPGWKQKYSMYRFKHWITSSDYFAGITAPFDLIARHPHTGAALLRYHELQRPYGEKESQNFLKQDYKMVYDRRNCDASASEVVELHELLQEKMYDSQYCYKHQWVDGDFVLTDNHGMLHGRLPFVDHTGRHLMRVHVI